MLRIAGFASMSVALRPHVLRNTPRLRASDMVRNWRRVSSKRGLHGFLSAQAAGDEDVAVLASE